MRNNGEATGPGESTSPAIEVVLALHEAMRDSRAEDVLALVDPGVVYNTLDDSKLDLYRGHAGMIRLLQDVHATHGDYQVRIVEVIEEPGPRVTVQAWVIPEPGRGQQFPTRLMYTVHHGLVTSIQSIPETPPARPGTPAAAAI